MRRNGGNESKREEPVRYFLSLVAIALVHKSDFSLQGPPIAFHYHRFEITENEMKEYKR